MTFNESKCVLLKIHSHKSKVTPTYIYKINDTEISEKSEHRDLGIIISGNLSWSTTKSLQKLTES